MDYAVKWSPEAIKDLESIAECIGKDGLPQSSRFFLKETYYFK